MTNVSKRLKIVVERPDSGDVVVQQKSLFQYVVEALEPLVAISRPPEQSRCWLLVAADVQCQTRSFMTLTGVQQEIVGKRTNFALPSN